MQTDSENNDDCPENLTWRSTLLRSLIGTTVLVSLLLGWTWLVSGRGYAERAATSLAMPIGVLWVTLFFSTIAMWLRGNRLAWLLAATAWAVIGISHNQYVARWVFGLVEHPVTASLDDQQPLRAVFVLGGGAGVDPLGNPQLGRDGQRLITGAQLYYQGKTKAVVCTGSAPGEVPNPSVIGRALLVSLGIPDEDIFELSGENTSQEMNSIKEFLANPPDGFPRGGECGVVTSAFHMHRAQRLAKARDLELQPIPCCFRQSGSGPFSPRFLIPDSGAASLMGSAIKELLARTVGR